MLAGCATSGNYWKETGPAVKVEAVIPLDKEAILAVCYQHVWGCFRRDVRIIYILESLDIKTKECVLTHELKHAAGYDHDDRPNYGVDCGTGEVWLSHILFYKEDLIGGSQKTNY